MEKSENDKVLKEQSQKEDNNQNKKLDINLISSKYIIQNIFSKISEKITLYLIMYNKRLTNSLEINSDDYKRLSRKYLIRDKDGNYKVYTQD